jgi:hypothetical protein
MVLSVRCLKTTEIQKGTTSMEMSVSTNYDSFNLVLTVTLAKADNLVLVEALWEYHINFAPTTRRSHSVCLQTTVLQ